MITVKTSPLYLEKKIADRLTLTREELRYIRGEILKRGKHWEIISNQVVLSESGLNAVLTRLRKTLNQPFEGLDFGDCLLVPAAEKKEAAARLEQLKVLRLFPNRKFLLAANSAGDNFRVRVPNSQNFRPHMALTARPLADGTYQLEGRCPRFPGRY